MVPECGRNEEDNGIEDENDWFAYDHSDSNAFRVFGAMVGPGVPANLSIGGPMNPVGKTLDVPPTVGEILGFKNEIMNAGYLGGGAMSLFDRM